MDKEVRERLDRKEQERKLIFFRMKWFMINLGRINDLNMERNFRNSMTFSIFMIDTN